MNEQILQELISSIKANPVTWFFEAQIIALFVSQVFLYLMMLWNKQDIEHIDLRKDVIRKQMADEMEEEKRLREERDRLAEEQQRIDAMLNEKKVRQGWRRKRR